MRATDIVGGPFTPPGFYYKTFIRPRRLWPLYEKVLRNAAGLGKLRETQPEREWRTEYRRRHADVLVVGGGVAGLQRRASPPPSWAPTSCWPTRAPSPAAGAGRGRPRAARRWPSARAAGVEILERGLGARLLRRPGAGLAGRHAAPGPRRAGTCSPPARSSSRSCSPATTCPGVMLSGGARRLAALYGVSARAARAVVATTSDRGLAAAAALRAAGVQIVAVADLRPSRARASALAPTASRCCGHTVVAPAAKAVTGGPRAGRRGPSSAVRVRPRGRLRRHDRRRARCCCRPAAAPATTRRAATSASRAARTASRRRRGRRATADAPRRSGERAGAWRRHGLGLGDERRRARRAAAGRGPRARWPCRPPVSGAGRGKCFACLCEDVTAKDIHLASRRATTRSSSPSATRR